jgi:hypothetical protein
MAEQENGIMFQINEETRKAIHEVIANKPFNAVFGITQIMSKDVLSEKEANAIINAIGQFPYAEVAGFFNNISKLFVEQKKETNETNETDKSLQE